MQQMTSRERVLKSLNFEQTDRIPKDLGAMRSTGVSAFAYPKLVDALGLPPRLPRVHDTSQMLALPDLDVLDALGCDVVTIDGGVTNAFQEPEKWHEYDFNGRLPALVQYPENFKVEEDDTIVQWGVSRMSPNAYVFNVEHAGNSVLDFDQPLPLLDLKQYKQDMMSNPLTDEQIKQAVDLCRRVRESTDKAVFYADHLNARIGICGHGGIAIFPMICMLEPGYVQDLHAISIESAMVDMRALLPEIRDYVDVIMTGCDDWGTQCSTIASPEVYQNLFLPYYKRVNDEAHRLAPDVKTFIHTCGAIYEVLDMMVESRFDIINPCQWPAGGHTYQEWKDKLRKRASIWGGGINTQNTLAFGSIEDIKTEAGEVSKYLSQDGGFIFNNIHNLLAEVSPEKIIALFGAV